jgi:hypothetical protein
MESRQPQVEARCGVEPPYGALKKISIILIQKIARLGDIFVFHGLTFL